MKLCHLRSFDFVLFLVPLCIVFTNDNMKLLWSESRRDHLCITLNSILEIGMCSKTAVGKELSGRKC